MVRTTWYIWVNIQNLLKNINWLGIYCLIVLVMVSHIFSNYSEKSLEIQRLLILCNVFSQVTISEMKNDKKKSNSVDEN